MVFCGKLSKNICKSFGYQVYSTLLLYQLNDDIANKLESSSLLHYSAKAETLLKKVLEIYSGVKKEKIESFDDYECDLCFEIHGQSLITLGNLKKIMELVELSKTSSSIKSPRKEKTPTKNKKLEFLIEIIIFHFKERIVVESNRAIIVENHKDDGEFIYLYSSKKTIAMVMHGLLCADPSNQLNLLLLRSLLAERVGGRWNSTQENCFVLLAIHKFFTTFEKEVPEFQMNAWIDEFLLANLEFKGRSTDSKVIKIPMPYLVSDDPFHQLQNKSHQESSVKIEENEPIIEQNKPEKEEKKERKITISKEGKGRLYYRLSLDYAPKDLFLKKKNYGFSVKRTYEPVEDQNDVVLEDGIYKIKAGKKVRVKIEFVSVMRRYHVALIDMLPSGLEQINMNTPELDSERKISTQEFFGRRNPFRYCFVESSHWFEHYNMRDERSEAFASVLHQGKYTFKYLLSATMEGSFVAPPCKVECMYSPEVFGNSETQFVTIIKN